MQSIKQFIDTLTPSLPSVEELLKSSKDLSREDAIRLKNRKLTFQSRDHVSAFQGHNFIESLIFATNLPSISLASIQFSSEIRQIDANYCFASFNSIDFVYRADDPEILYYDLVEEKLYYYCATDADHFMAACVEAAKRWYDFMFRSKAIEIVHIEAISQLAGGEKYHAFWAYLLPLGVKDWE